MSEKIDWNKYTMKDCVLGIKDYKPNYNMTFYRNGKQIGALDFNGPQMTFTGDAEESAKVFFDLIAESFKGRLEQERAAEREACAKWLEDVVDAPNWAEQIRARGQA